MLERAHRAADARGRTRRGHPTRRRDPLPLLQLRRRGRVPETPQRDRRRRHGRADHRGGGGRRCRCASTARRRCPTAGTSRRSAPGAPLPSDATCAQRVHRSPWEPRSDNDDAEPHQAERSRTPRGERRVRPDVERQVQAADHRRLHRHDRRDHPVGGVQVGHRRQHGPRAGGRRDALAHGHGERQGAAFRRALPRRATTATRARRRSASCRSSGTSTRARARAATATR